MYPFLIKLLQVETFLDYDKSSQGVVFTTDRTYQPGEQVKKILLFSGFHLNKTLQISKISSQKAIQKKFPECYCSFICIHAFRESLGKLRGFLKKTFFWLFV